MNTSRSIYLFYGNEDFLLDEEIRRLKGKLVSPGMGNLNFEVIDAEMLEIYGLKESKVAAASLAESKEAWQRPLRW